MLKYLSSITRLAYLDHLLTKLNSTFLIFTSL
jgi:hypothetical protein